MTDYKLVPIGPTPEMVEAAQDAYMPFGDMELAIRMAVLAAPAVQVVPVAYAVFTGNGNIRIWSSNPVQAETMRQKYGDQVRPLYAAPQHAEQQPDVTQLVEALDAALMVMTSKEVRLEKWADAITSARAALAAYRKKVNDVE